ncbi:MAG TPA: UDP-N-acetylglucosamine 2-epimerase (non-hydrolyzing) [Allosphingosinicella sp.]
MAADRPLIVSIVGTRPEAIKLAPVLRALAARPDFEQRLILTGQHPGLARQFDFLPVDDLAIDPREQSAGELRENLHYALLRQFVRRRPDLVLVQGDTTSAVAGALAARDCGIPVAHVEAGLRSHDLDHPWPEEANRIVIDELAALLFAPTERAAGNLAAEPNVTGAIHVTGNSGIDALFEACAAAPGPAPADDARRTILVTCHRRENRTELFKIATALKRIVRQLPLGILFLLHPNPYVRRAVEPLLGGEPYIQLLEPVGHEEMVALMARSWLILTDSGGLQEEGAALGRPVLVLRTVTERSEALDTANAELVGTDPARIFAAVSCLLADEEKYAAMARPTLAFGDGHAAPRIADEIGRFLARA